MPRIDLGARLKGDGPTYRFAALKFGKTCVCCNQNAWGRTQDYDPSTDQIHVTAMPMPVCFDCRDHALQAPKTAIAIAGMLCSGAAFTGLGAYYVSHRPSDPLPAGLLVVGLGLVAGAIVWMVRVSRRRKTAAQAGDHHPGLTLSVGLGGTVLVTTNDTLADELVALNADAKILADRRDDKRLARARVVQRDRE